MSHEEMLQVVDPPLDKILQVCQLIEKTPDKSEYIKLQFVKGLPVSLNGKTLPLHDLIMKLNALGAKHGVGVTHHIEDRLVGLKVRGLYEAPAAEIIINAHFNLEKYVCTRQENEFKSLVDTKWAYLCYGALWHEPLMDDLNAYIEHVNQKVSGVVTVKLHKGQAEVVAVDTANTIFDEKLATFMKSSAFNQNASAGFIEIYTLQMRLAQDKERFALLTVGDEHKKALLPIAKALRELGFLFYATEGTHTFLKKNHINSILVHKMFTKQSPNLESVMRQDLFDLVINIPYEKPSKEFVADNAVIRQWALENNVPLLRDIETAAAFVEKLQKRMVVRKKKACLGIHTCELHEV
jgi:argininosuccinate synthase